MKLAKVLDRDVIDKSFRKLRTLLKEDEFQESGRFGEYGRTVPSAARSASQPDHSAPVKRINAFYTYCACEYLLAYEAIESRAELSRIFSFAENKLTPYARYYTTRTEDGYVAGSHGSSAKQELNYRHTFALGLIVALANQDHARLSRIRSLLLEDGVQTHQGGWHIWEGNVQSGVQPDPICSGYALILLDYFKKYSLDTSQSEQITKKLQLTIDYLLSILDRDIHLWRAPGDNYVETYQMSVWYYTLLEPYIRETRRDRFAEIHRSLGEGLSPERIQMFDSSPFGIDVKARLVYAIIATAKNAINGEYIDRANNVLKEILRERNNGRGFTTFGLTRLMILLRELEFIGLPQALGNVRTEPVLDRGVYLLGRFVRGYIGP